MRNVIVTGGSRGLGLAISRRLVADGFHVVAVARKPSEALEEEIARASGALSFAALDLSDVDAIPDFVLRLKKEFGAPYGLVNNAGLGTEGLLATMHNSQIEMLTRVNVTAPIVLTKYVVRNMMSAGAGGRIVNMSSIIASTGYNALSVYGATKAALIGFTKSLSREVGRMGVTVNAVAPGFVETEMTASLGDADRGKIAARAALRRLAMPEDVANAVSFLLDDKARNITGTVVTVDAGATA
ncbi:SDR family oxidoreductase [Methylocystis sp. MJC1]|jgi:3-oxoacyl-[acyl-carrier protein] reductase|uniref:SDR family NAD(P)-dependent oxidoreductase n=1 Tax=Methylocystis sp. MJC1 TaxID=2654282 RepID=UPI0013EAEB97|nr:SDR family NAD(P)-dependent oxidoreductase [Methylocystis sp. MJC1]KAF2992683.1 3-oxoacyl-[acyl-carrier-protein] reductase FabG [Methylocystis sp. MJC1]MBU6526648.1 SDR family oxidoreductase [Methylocystis sp. MJC1]UZX13090.1 SDR family oxidoreductase [Methylocystis sp. MJC1]